MMEMPQLPLPAKFKHDIVRAVKNQDLTPEEAMTLLGWTSLAVIPQPSEKDEEVMDPSRVDHYQKEVKVPQNGSQRAHGASQGQETTFYQIDPNAPQNEEAWIEVEDQEAMREATRALYETRPDPEMVQYFKDNPLPRIHLDPPKTIDQLEMEAYIRAIREPIMPSEPTRLARIKKFLWEWDRGTYTARTQLDDEEVWRLRAAKRISFEQALEMAPMGRAWVASEEAWRKSEMSDTRTLSGKQAYTPGSSPSTRGTTSTNTPASKEPSSSSTSSGWSGQGRGARHSYVYLGEMGGFY